MNPLSSYLVQETKLFNLSTRSTACNILNEDTNYKSRCEYNIPNMIVNDESVEYIQFSLPEVVIPVSFYIINENNCQLDIVLNGVETSYLFPYGNYNANYFMTQFKLILGSAWNISLSNFNSVFTVSNSGSDFTFLGSSTVSSIMGFSQDVISNNQAAVMPRCCNFMSLPRICIRCRELANTTMVGSNTTSDVIMAVPNNSKANGQIVFINRAQSKMLFRSHELSRFIVSFTDDDGNLLNFNGVSSFFTIQFDIFRRWSPKLPRFQNIVEYVNSKTPIFYQETEEEMNI